MTMTRAAGGEDDVDVAHDHVGQLDGGDIDPADDALGGTGLDGGVKYELGGGDGALGGSRVRGDDDGVAGLRLISVLKIAVEVGLVVGMTAPTMPMGSAILVMP
mgnify:CR=1 FL=1